jgi:EmrB/QacA subfamily drug resistance transporter
VNAAAASRRDWITLAVLLTGMFVSLLDATIVNVALPSIRNSLNASESSLSWIISGYALGLGLALIPAGRVGDQVGHKWVFITGLALFTLASLACGIAADDTQLVIGRFLQGLAGGIYLPAVGSFIQLLFTGKQRGQAFGILGATVGLSSVFGMMLGGIIIEIFGAAQGWRWVFFVNLPIGLLGVIAAILILPSHEKHLKTKGGLDLFGAVILAAGLVAILVPLIEGQQEGWPLWTWLSLAGGIVCVGLFGVWENGVTKRGSSPLVPLRLFHHASFTLGSILALLYFAGFTSIFFTLAILWQAGLGHTALESGLLTVPIAISTLISSMLSQRIVARMGRNALSLGAGLMTFGLAGFWLLLLVVPAAELNELIFIVPLLAIGTGNGLFLAPNVQFIISTVDNAEAGAASGVINTMQRLGTSIGVAVIGSILFGSLAIPAGKPSADQIATAFSHSAMLAMGTSAILAFIAFLLVYALPKSVAQHGPRPVVFGD